MSHLETKDFDYTGVLNVLEKIKYVKNLNVVLISTVLPKTCRNKFKEIIDSSKCNFIYNPYLISIGTTAKDMLKAKTFIRVKGNLYPSQNKLSQHKSHKDYEYEHKAAIYCINTCDGYTMFEDGKTIPSVANRLITFDGSMQHASTDCTNAKSRININFNYL